MFVMISVLVELVHSLHKTLNLLKQILVKMLAVQLVCSLSVLINNKIAMLFDIRPKL